MNSEAPMQAGIQVIGRSERTIVPDCFCLYFCVQVSEDTPGKAMASVLKEADKVQEALANTTGKSGPPAALFPQMSFDISRTETASKIERAKGKSFAVYQAMVGLEYTSNDINEFPDILATLQKAKAVANCFRSSISNLDQILHSMVKEAAKDAWDKAQAAIAHANVHGLRLVGLREVPSLQPASYSSPLATMEAGDGQPNLSPYFGPRHLEVILTALYDVVGLSETPNDIYSGNDPSSTDSDPPT